MTAPRPRRPSTDAEAAALASEIRLRILRITRFDPLTNKEIAEALGKDPATTLHHVRKLVDTGFLAALPARRGKRGSREIPYRATGLSWQLDNVHRPAIGEAMLQAYLNEIAEVDFQELDQTRMVVQVGPERKAELVNRLAMVLEEFSQAPPDEGGERIGVYTALYPMGKSFGNVGVTWDDDSGNTTDER
ncbi:ArsR/SmtB family transcription factor [Labedaea rhizosphaerae]|uniref:Helix-turn-helix protein n=1 Tax=Labedaea rhizosphaerae TaxID=598644 RepID=A0A4R6RQW7_LABRH|nr:winged helix-turn-helix domain-containing protein [Labedaea rhizosphaerae]TDP89199.1 helix-turn-helix protein [Labedaea rhizosphaerae]